MDSYAASSLVNITFRASCLIYRRVLPPVMSIVFSGEARKQQNVNISCRPITPPHPHQPSLSTPELWFSFSISQSQPHGSWLFLTKHPQVTQNVTGLAFHHGWPYENTFKTCKLTSAGLLEHMEARLGAVFLSIHHCCSWVSGFTVVFCTAL